MSPDSAIRRIVLTGFMGAGKSTVGMLLAQRLGWQFVDADAVIEARAGMTIAEIFAQQGEAAFRVLEAETIRELSQAEKLVLSLGGGAVETQATRDLLPALDQTCVVFLDAPLETLVARCLSQPGAAERPVLADRERLRLRFEARLPHYRSAHLTIATAELELPLVVDRILDSIEKRCLESVPAQ